MTEVKPAAPEVRARVDSEPDFVASRHHDNSLRALMARYSAPGRPNDEVPMHVRAKALGRTEKQLSAMWALTLRQLRRFMGVKKGE